MARNKKGSGSQAAAGSSCFGTWAKIIAVALAVLAPLIALAERNLESFYIFDHGELHELSQRAIAAHGEDTQAMVDYIVSELKEKHPSHVNLDQEWVFNNAGGAMGAMYIIHASMCFPLFPFPPFPAVPLLDLTADLHPH